MGIEAWNEWREGYEGSNDWWNLRTIYIECWDFEFKLSQIIL